MKKVLRTALALAFLYACWLGMLALHEFGHVFNAHVVGAQVKEVIIPRLGFSQTVIGHNPATQFVGWGGATMGCIIPLMACGLARLFTRRVPGALRFFTGFCLIANGAYMGLGWLGGANDSADLVKHGESPVKLIFFGVSATFVGLLLWHRIPWLTLTRGSASTGGDASPPGLDRVDPALQIRHALQREDEQPGEPIDHPKQRVLAGRDGFLRLKLGNVRANLAQIMKRIGACISHSRPPATKMH